jgi:hypothetical protein
MRGPACRQGKLCHGMASHAWTGGHMTAIAQHAHAFGRPKRPAIELLATHNSPSHMGRPPALPRWLQASPLPAPTAGCGAPALPPLHAAHRCGAVGSSQSAGEQQAAIDPPVCRFCAEGQRACESCAQDVSAAAHHSQAQHLAQGVPAGPPARGTAAGAALQGGISCDCRECPLAAAGIAAFIHI